MTVPADVLKTYVGRYRQDNSRFVTIGLDGDQLTLQVEGREKLALTALSPQQFNMPAGVGTVTFAADGNTYEVRRPTGEVIKGTKQ